MVERERQLVGARGGFAAPLALAVLLLVGFVAPAALANGGAALLDARSRECLACHRASIGEISSLRNPQLVMVGSRLGSHSVGVRYDEAWRANPQGLRPLSSLPLSIELPGGRVTCVSCHRPTEPSHMA